MIIIIVTLEWVQEYQMQYPDASRLQAEVNEFMANYDAKKEQVFCQCFWFFLFCFIRWADCYLSNNKRLRLEDLSCI